MWMNDIQVSYKSTAKILENSGTICESTREAMASTVNNEKGEVSEAKNWKHLRIVKTFNRAFTEFWRSIKQWDSLVPEKAFKFKENEIPNILQDLLKWNIPDEYDMSEFKRLLENHTFQEELRKELLKYNVEGDEGKNVWEWNKELRKLLSLKNVYAELNKLISEAIPESENEEIQVSEKMLEKESKEKGMIKVSYKNWVNASEKVGAVCESLKEVFGSIITKADWSESTAKRGDKYRVMKSFKRALKDSGISVSKHFSRHFLLRLLNKEKISDEVREEFEKLKNNSYFTSVLEKEISNYSVEDGYKYKNTSSDFKEMLLLDNIFDYVDRMIIMWKIERWEEHVWVKVESNKKEIPEGYFQYIRLKETSDEEPFMFKDLETWDFYDNITNNPEQLGYMEIDEWDWFLLFDNYLVSKKDYSIIAQFKSHNNSWYYENLWNDFININNLLISSKNNEVILKSNIDFEENKFNYIWNNAFVFWWSVYKKNDRQYKEIWLANLNYKIINIQNKTFIEGIADSDFYKLDSTIEFVEKVIKDINTELMIMRCWRIIQINKYSWEEIEVDDWIENWSIFSRFFRKKELPMYNNVDDFMRHGLEKFKKLNKKIFKNHDVERFLTEGNIDWAKTVWEEAVKSTDFKGGSEIMREQLWFDDSHASYRRVNRIECIKQENTNCINR